MGQERREGQAGRTVVAVGLTGSIGAGKSTALSMFEECGAVVLSADQLVHQLYERPDVVALMAEHFGSGVLGAGERVGRGRLAEAVKGRPEELHWLEELTHPRVAEEVARLLKEAPEGSVVVCEIPLLFESEMEGLFDLVVTVEAAEETRRLRSVHDFGLEQFGELEGLQVSREQRMAEADLCFVNDGGFETLREFVREAYATAKGLLSSQDVEEPE